jgi:membrane-bound lytic murein transglycosylase A
VERSAAAWLRACAQLKGVSGNADLRERLEHLFVPFAVAALDQNGQSSSEGKFTGYYEASLEGSFTRQGPYQVPIYGVPQDLVRADLRQFVPDLPSSVPRQIVGRVTGTTAGRDLAPYFTRHEIDRQGVLNGKARVLIWAKDPAAVHILHIQGSGRVTLPDGRRVGVGFAGHNGLAFRGIGGVLLKAGVLRPGEGSMGHVRQWLRDHPKEAARYMDENARYIFFHLTAGETAAGPLGSQGVPLTPGRSLAVDPRFIPLGAMLWLDTRDPDGRPIQRLMVAQDTGAAIKGPVRGDLFWGYGEDAFAMAARMHSSGKYYILVPAQ